MHLEKKVSVSTKCFLEADTNEFLEAYESTEIGMDSFICYDNSLNYTYINSVFILVWSMVIYK